MVPVFLGLFAADRNVAAIVVYGCAAGTDFLDGLLARRLGQVSDLGKLLDPLADRIFILALTLVLAFKGTLWWWLALVIVGRDVLLVALYPVVGKRGLGRIPVNLAGKWATACLLFGLTWLAVSLTSLPWKGAHALGLGSVLLGVGLYLVATFLYGREVVARSRGAPPEP